MSQLFTSGGQSIGASVSASVLPMNIQGWFLLGLTGLSSLLFKKISKSLLQHYNLKASVLWHSVFFMCQLSNLYIIAGETIASSIEAFVRKRMSSPLNMISMFVIAFFPKNKYLLMSWLQSPSTVILEPPKIKSVTPSTFPHSICYEVMEPNAMILVFLMLSFKLAFSLSSFTLSKKLFSLLHFLPLEWYHLHTWDCWYFSWQSWFSLWFIQPSTSHDVYCI